MSTTEQHFVELVAAMRAAQRTYFSLRDKHSLLQAKELERDVDYMLIELKKNNNC